MLSQPITKNDMTTMEMTMVMATATMMRSLSTMGRDE